MLDAAIEVLRVHEIDSLKQWEGAAREVRAEAEKGADLRPHLEVLQRAFLESQQVPIMEPLADALAVYLLKHDEAGLAALLGDEAFSPYVLMALARYEAPLPVLLQAFPTTVPGARAGDPVSAISARVARCVGGLPENTAESVASRAGARRQARRDRRCRPRRAPGGRT